jgi:phosphoribosylanthranilate isomerase
VNTVRVKICGITRLQDLECAVTAGVDALGFVFTERSGRFIAPDRARDLVAAVPAFVARVGLFMDSDAEEVARILDRVPLNLLQFHGSESGAFCRQFGLPYIKALSMHDGRVSADDLGDFADAAGVLLDSHRPGGTSSGPPYRNCRFR